MIGGVIFDFNGTLFDPSTGDLYPGVLAMLKEMHSGIMLVLFSRREETREARFRELGIDQFFIDACFVSNKTREEFAGIITRHNLERKTCVVVGDSVGEEIALGNEFDMTTIRVRQGKYANEEPTSALQIPSHTVYSIGELRSLLKKLA